jgi:hypothetical protein
MASNSWDQKDLFYFCPEECIPSDPVSDYMDYVLDSNEFIVGLRIQAKNSAERVFKCSHANAPCAAVVRISTQAACSTVIKAGNQKLTLGEGDGLT